MSPDNKQAVANAYTCALGEFIAALMECDADIYSDSGSVAMQSFAEQVLALEVYASRIETNSRAERMQNIKAAHEMGRYCVNQLPPHIAKHTVMAIQTAKLTKIMKAKATLDK